MSLRYPIQVVSRLSGLSVHVIRVWEKRYGAVQPTRTATNRRLYEEGDIERLRLLRTATEGGYSISLIARLGEPDLRRLVAGLTPSPVESAEAEPGARALAVGETAGAGEPVGPWNGHRRALPETGEAVAGAVVSGDPAPKNEGAAGDPLIGEAVSAIEAFAAERLTGVLERATLKYGANGALHRVIAPLSQEMGARWQHGLSTAAHEHFASSLIRDFLRRAARGFPQNDDTPRALVATPAGQLHELGAVMAATVATNLGWRAIYLGASLPSAEIAGAALQNGVRVVLLSVVYPGDDPNLPGELRQLRRHLPTSVPLVVGGRSATAYRTVLEEVGAWVPEDLQALANCLERVRTG